MKKFLAIVFLAISFSFAIKCSDALYIIVPAINFLNRDYILVQRNFHDIFKKDTSYREVYFHWKGTTTDHKLEWLDNTRFIYESKIENPPYSQKGKAPEFGVDINYAENNSAGHLEYNKSKNQEEKDAERTSPYKSSDITVIGDTIFQVQYYWWYNETYIEKLYLKNDSLFFLRTAFFKDSQGSIFGLDSSAVIYTNDSENEELCVEYVYDEDSLKFILNTDPDIIKIKSVTQHGDSIIYSETNPNSYNSKKDYVFLPVEKVLEKGSITAIKKKGVLPRPTARKNRYYDLKGRTYSNQIPYRVFF